MQNVMNINYTGTADIESVKSWPIFKKNQEYSTIFGHWKLPEIFLSFLFWRITLNMFSWSRLAGIVPVQNNMNLEKETVNKQSINVVYLEQIHCEKDEIKITL